MLAFIPVQQSTEKRAQNKCQEGIKMSPGVCLAQGGDSQDSLSISLLCKDAEV